MFNLELCELTLIIIINGYNDAAGAGECRLYGSAITRSTPLISEPEWSNVPWYTRANGKPPLLTMPLVAANGTLTMPLVTAVGTPLISEPGWSNVPWSITHYESTLTWVVRPMFCIGLNI